MDYKGKKIVVTGGAGFIGSHISSKLSELGAKVTVIDDLSTGNIANLQEIMDKIRFVEGSILDVELLKKEFEGAFAICHQAALPSVPKSIELPLETHAANATGTLNVFYAAKEAKVERVVYASSSSVYGDTVELPKVETMNANPLSPYAAQKMMGEVYGKIFFRLFGLKTIGLRYFNVFGPRQNPNSAYAAVIPKFITKIGKGERPEIYGDGEHTRDFTYVDNVVDANLKAMLAQSGFGEAYNIAAGTQISLNQLVKKICNILGKEVEPTYLDPRKGDIKDSFAEVSKAGKAFGYKPEIGFEEGLKRTIESYI